jgi:hypothetical protein
MPAASIFGPLIDESDVERALLAHLERWMPTYLGRLVRLRDPDGSRFTTRVPEVRQYAWRDAGAEKLPEHQLPMLLARGTGEADDPGYQGDGVVDKRFTIYLIAVCQGIDPDEAREAARLFGSAAEMAITQHEDLGGFAAGVRMQQGGRYPISKQTEGDRFLSAVYRPYVVEVEDTMVTSAGPIAPVANPEVEPDPWPTVKEGGGTVAVDALRAGGFFGSD